MGASFLGGNRLGGVSAITVYMVTSSPDLGKIPPTSTVPAVSHPSDCLILFRD